jgi:hypothetical protein
MWATRRDRLLRSGDGLLAQQCNVTIDKWIKELIKVCKDGE